MKAKDVHVSSNVVRFADGWSVRVSWLPRVRQYHVVLTTPAGEPVYGWHPVPHSCIALPTAHHTWKLAQATIKRHTAIHGGVANV